MPSYRKFHLNDFPKDKIYISLDENFRNRFFKKLYNKIGGSTILSGFIKGVKDEEVRRWKVGIRDIPLWALFILNNFLKKDKFTIEELEKNIFAYKTKSSRKMVHNPKLPLVEDERLVRTVTHIICDGYDGGKNHPPAYFNTESTLVDNFSKDLELFGQINITRRIRIPKEGNKPLYSVEFPKVISHVLRHIYKIKFGSKSSRLPKNFFFLSIKLANQIVKSFADDESHVGESFIIFVSSNRKLLNDLKKLIKLKLYFLYPFLTGIKYLSSAKAYNFSLKRGGLTFFYKKVNFDHPEKRKILNFLINRKSTPGNKFKEGEAKNLIFEILSKGPSSSIELSQKLGIKPKNIRYHLYNLKEEGKIIDKKEKIYRSKIWSVKNAQTNMLHQ